MQFARAGAASSVTLSAIFYRQRRLTYRVHGFLDARDVIGTAFGVVGRVRPNVKSHDFVLDEQGKKLPDQTQVHVACCIMRSIRAGKGEARTRIRCSGSVKAGYLEGVSLCIPLYNIKQFDQKLDICIQLDLVRTKGPPGHER